MKDITKGLSVLLMVVAMSLVFAVGARAQNDANATGAAPESLSPGESMPANDDLAKKALDNIKSVDLSTPEEKEDYSNKDYDLTLNMGDAVKLALEKNNSILAAKATALGAEAARKSAIGDFLPSFSVQYSYTRYDHDHPGSNYEKDYWSMGLNVHQDIFTGGRLENSYMKAKINRDKASDDLFNSELDLIQSVQENFLALLQAREDVRSAKDSVTRLQSQLRVTQAFYDVGLKPKLDVLQAEVDLAQAEDTLLQARNSVFTQEARLNTLLTEHLEAKIYYTGELEYLPFSMSVEECLSRAYDNRPDIKAAEKNIQAAEKDVKIARSSMLPQLGADVNLSRTGNSPAVNGNKYSSTGWSTWSVELGVSWQVFDFGSSWYSWREAQQGVKAYEATLENLRQEVAYSIKANHLKIDEAKERIKVARKALVQAKESYRMAVARYQAQVGTNTDVLDAQSQLTKAEATLTQAMADYQTALAGMYVAMGMKNYTLTAY